MQKLVWHSYRYYPYEIELARREISTLLPAVQIKETQNGIELLGDVDQKIINRLVYFAAMSGEKNVVPTMQAQLERVNGNGLNRQSTRYSAHGLHEYKGKFNPQVARAILNILNIPTGSRIIDPFCGSGTSLLECEHFGMRAIGTDINPLAVFIANAKLKAIHIPVELFRDELQLTLKRCKASKNALQVDNDVRHDYLLSWFDSDVLNDLEKLRLTIRKRGSVCAEPLLAIASSLLRNYSQQDPQDLRIRRRKSPLPEKPFLDAFEEGALQFIAKLENLKAVLKRPASGSKAMLFDSRRLDAEVLGIRGKLFDCALTSPPYATALPYIDTQRLSLVWLGLIQPNEILPLEAHLVGSREIRGQAKQTLAQDLQTNSARLPLRQAKYCKTLQTSLTEADGFRRQAVPLLLYRYFAHMAEMFRSLRPLMRSHAPFALIVGGNHTVLSGRRFDINTPEHLAEIATVCGWEHIETMPLQTYQRYGYHKNNAVSTEALVIVRAV